MRAVFMAVAIASILVVSSPTVLYAQYLDPGTGSYIFQLLIAGGAALFYSALRFKTQISNYVKQLIQH